METSSDNGLTVIFDDETNLITLDWDPETHPEYNIFEGMTSEEFCEMILEYAEKVTNEKASTTKVSTRGPSCGEAQGDGNSELEV